MNHGARNDWLVFIMWLCLWPLSDFLLSLNADQLYSVLCTLGCAQSFLLFLSSFETLRHSRLSDLRSYGIEWQRHILSFALCCVHRYAHLLFLSIVCLLCFHLHLHSQTADFLRRWTVGRIHNNFLVSLVTERRATPHDIAHYLNKRI